MSAAAPLLRLEAVHKSYGDVEVLRGVDLDVAEGDVVCLIGASGCGKSTLLKCANLIEPISAGRILLEGEEITSEDTDPDRVRRHIGIVFQAFNLFPHMNVLANVTLAPRRVLGMPQRAAEERARELLARFGLAEKARSTRTGSPAGSSSARRSRGRSPCSRACSCSTRSRARSTRSSSGRCSP